MQILFVTQIVLELC